MDYDTSQEDFMNKTKQDLEEIEIDEKVSFQGCRRKL